MKKQEKNILVYYHANCADGFGAAWSAWRKLGAEADYISYQHGKGLPNDFNGKTIYSVDLCFHDPILENILESAAKLVVIDHHISAVERLKEIPNAVFDNNHSGAALAWQYFHPGEPTPKLLLYVEDNDLWRFKLPFAKEISCALSLSEFNFDEWNKMAAEFEDKEKFNQYVERGGIILKKSKKEAGEMSGEFYFIDFEGIRVPTVNTPLHVSEIGHRLSEKHSGMAIMWSRRKDEIRVSLRSDGRVDVSKMAAKYGGGGHEAASGFNISLTGKEPNRTINPAERALQQDFLRKLLS